MNIYMNIKIPMFENKSKNYQAFEEAGNIACNGGKLINQNWTWNDTDDKISSQSFEETKHRWH